MMNAVRRGCLGATVSRVTIPSTPLAKFSTDHSVPLALIAEITAYQSGSGDPSPDNVRTINGYTGLSIWLAGKNLLGFPRLMDGATLTYNVNRLSVSYSDGILSAIVQNSGSSTRDITIAMKAANQIILPKGISGYFTLSFNHEGMRPNSSNLLRTQIRFTNNTTLFGNTPYNASKFALSTGSISWPLGRTISGAYLAATYSASATIGDVIKFWDLQLEHADANPTATDYEESVTASYPILFPNDMIVYGGTYNAQTGVLTVTHGNIASYDGESINEPWISSMDVYTPGGTPTTGAQVVYPLSTPVEYSLAPTALSSLVGQNNIWADTGNVSLSFFN